ncbi:PfkB family carbohydrate kinase [Shewanella surugensis]|uniref:PfkB family carbohydrate kinase n=1 Tax=Shewanella surugensis TaxID=212020 RepID=A0ABT0LAL7_9GAMM|nr:PfkB family carbohydrate kinase [Shewanella surugensis]MCL1124405.1 PfkB family carbohydrate kinase [Shewanella surugensis]
MANILLVANLNCDRVLQLPAALHTGGRFYYQEQGIRLGGGGANTGIGLVWAEHCVQLVSQVGNDDKGDWLLKEAISHGVDCHQVQRHGGMTCEMLLMMAPDGERTILRPMRVPLTLPIMPDWKNIDVLYVNSSAEGLGQWTAEAMIDCLVVTQLAKDNRRRDAHVLITSESDFKGRCQQSPWLFARDIAGMQLQYFIVTDGGLGAKLYTPTGMIQVSARQAKVCDTTGAGDAYAAGLIHGLTKGDNIDTAMQEAAIWSTFSVASQTSIPGVGLKQYLQNEGTLGY